MRILIIFIVVLQLTTVKTSAQKKEDPSRKPTSTPAKQNQKRYGSLLWEITGNGLTKPSYLFGTMHVSDKLAFHLGDSFYHAIKKADVVALETNPEHWQDNFSGSNFLRNRRGRRNNINFRSEYPTDQMTITSFSFDSYEDIIKASLSVEPSMINGMLYRTYGTQLDDFEEDTFLDMYIFQVGKKLGKRLAGVEDFEESEKLVMEAYRDMLKDKNRKRKSYDFEGMMMNPKKLEEAYRRGDLDMLDSLQAMTVFSDAFQEKFLYKRNEIQAKSIDTILKKASLFVGVGAAHLPGKRGVIEMLRRMGYTLRPVHMDERNSVQKDAIDRMRAKAKFISQSSPDGFYKVSIPGSKFYRFTDWGVMDVVQYADMINGAYYVVNRVKTNSSLMGHSPELVQKKIDSFLYENIPGKILKKTMITRNGYKGWDILNRTRRGDHQRYNIYITPFEVIIFKMSGNGEYILNGDEAQQFFNSVHLKEYTSSSWVAYQPQYGGFTARFPHDPSVIKGNSFFEGERLEWAAHDAKENNTYFVVKNSLHNYRYLEEDSFELNLMEESYSFSPFIEKQISRQFIKVKGYPGLLATYKHIDGSFSAVKYVIQGASHYVVIARYQKDSENVNKFIQSFTITPFVYGATKLRVDSAMGFTVQSPVYPEEKKKDKEMEELENSLENIYEEEIGYLNEEGSYKSKLIGNDTTGEKIFVISNKASRFAYQKDTTKLWAGEWGEEEMEKDDSNFIYKVKKQYNLPNGIRCRDIELRDTGSSRTILSRTYFKEGHYFIITTLTDTLSPRSAFLEKFFGSFSPADTIKGPSLYTRKTENFFKEFFSKDSLTSLKASRSLRQVSFDSLDVSLIMHAIDSLHWGMRNYLGSKKYLFAELGKLKDPAITPYLKKNYFKVGDTSEFQHTILQSLLSQRTTASFAVFKELILQEPPILENEEDYSYRSNHGGLHFREISFVSTRRSRYVDYDGRWPDLFDTLSLTKTIFPDFLQLINVDDYKEDVMNLLQRMVDSGQLKATDYEAYYSKIYLEAKQLLKKQVAREEQDNIEKATIQSRPEKYSDEEENDELDRGNDDLEQYAVLLMPFWEKNQVVKDFFKQLLKSKDKQLLYATMMLMLRNKKEIPDSLIIKYAADDSYRMKLYDDLSKIKLTDRIPAAYKTQLSYTKSTLYSVLNNYQKPDSVVYLDRLPVIYKNKKGWVYFYKYRSMRDDNYWELAAIGMQPEKENEIDIKNSDFNQNEGVKLLNDIGVREQMEKMLREMLNAHRPSAESFYESRNRGMYKNYLTELVKNSRYRD